jgi:hypothetical protein
LESSSSNILLSKESIQILHELYVPLAKWNEEKSQFFVLVFPDMGLAPLQ